MMVGRSTLFNHFDLDIVFLKFSVTCEVSDVPCYSLDEASGATDVTLWNSWLPCWI